MSYSENDGISPGQDLADDEPAPGRHIAVLTLSDDANVALGDAGSSQPPQPGRYISTTIRDRLLMSFSSGKYSRSTDPDDG
jgi:hypothetical protein